LLKPSVAPGGARGFAGRNPAAARLVSARQSSDSWQHAGRSSYPAVIACSSARHTRLRARTAVTAPIIGPHTLEQLDDVVRATEIVRGEDVLKRLDEIFPCPGGATPGAHAW
jgi:aryl-alcohol dehydrogenase-like predicted oxidoreductase